MRFEQELVCKDIHRQPIGTNFTIVHDERARK